MISSFNESKFFSFLYIRLVINSISQTISFCLVIEGKLICHCSGAMSAEVFSGIHEKGAYGYSIHLMFPFNSKTIPYEMMQTAFFTVEGSPEKRAELVSLFEGFGNPVTALDGENKTKYHAAAVMASNQVVALMEIAVRLLKKCQFQEGIYLLQNLTL